MRSQEELNSFEIKPGEHFLIGALSQTLYVVMIVLNFLKRFWPDFVYAYVVMRLVYGNQL